MSRKSKARRRARRARAQSLLSRLVEPSEPWGSGPPLTVEERARVVARYSELRGRSVTLRFTLIPIWVPASTPEELVAATAARLLEESRDKLAN